VSDSTTSAVVGYSWLFPVLMTVAHVMVNGLRFSDLVKSAEDEPGVAAKTRVFLIIAIVLQIVVLAVCGYVMGQEYLSVKSAEDAPKFTWGGVSLFTSQVVMFVAAWMQRLFSLPPSES
jgi:ABC-type enterochelin transport system permease subunit